MATADTIQGVELPTPDDQPAIPDHLAALWYAMIARGLPRFSTVDMRDERIGSPVDGMACITGSGTTTRLWMALGGWRELARASSATALAAVMPPSDNVDVDAQFAVTSTAWQDVPGAVLSLVLPASARVRLTADMWIDVTNPGMGVRAGIAVSGATTVAPEEPSWGAVARRQAYVGSSAGDNHAGKEVELAAGTNTIRLRARRDTAGTTGAGVNYPSLSYQVVRWL